MCSILYYNVHAEMTVQHLCFVFPVSVSLLANLPEDKLSKIVDCLEVVSYSVKLSIFLLERQSDVSLPRCCTTIWQLMGDPVLQIAAVKISLPFGHIPLLCVSIFFLPPVGKTSQITYLMNRADIIPVIAGRCILLP